jgi:pyruvate/oxaloacetate carboxyltransferase
MKQTEKELIDMRKEMYTLVKGIYGDPQGKQNNEVVKAVFDYESFIGTGMSYVCKNEFNKLRYNYNKWNIKSDGTLEN